MNLGVFEHYIVKKFEKVRAENGTGKTNCGALNLWRSLFHGAIIKG